METIPARHWTRTYKQYASYLLLVGGELSSQLGNAPFAGLV